MFLCFVLSNYMDDTVYGCKGKATSWNFVGFTNQEKTKHELLEYLYWMFCASSINEL